MRSRLLRVSLLMVMPSMAKVPYTLRRLLLCWAEVVHLTLIIKPPVICMILYKVYRVCVLLSIYNLLSKEKTQLLFSRITSRFHRALTSDFSATRIVIITVLGIFFCQSAEKFFTYTKLGFPCPRRFRSIRPNFSSSRSSLIAFVVCAT